jgi:Zn-dependent peptidase ImmA (M78 family)
MMTFADCVMREFDDRQEEEADWLAGALLAPEPALKRAKVAGPTHAQTAQHLGASVEARSLALGSPMASTATSVRGAQLRTVDGGGDRD